jgi:release factor glutamine methyltransferase
LEAHDIDGAQESAETLLAGVLGTDRAGLYSRSEGLSSAEARTFGRALCLRCAGTPLQHITGEQAFRRISLQVRPGVFVPRPETEILVGAVLDELGELRDVPSPLIADVGTGTGAIALSIKRERPDARVLATDLSPAAVALARENAGRLHLDVDIREGDLLSPLPQELRNTFDVIVSNPPYVSAQELETLSAEVLADPRLALEGGIDVYDPLAKQAAEWCAPRGLLAVEIGERQAADVAGVMRANGFDNVRTLPDLAGRDRVVLGRRSAP